MKIKNSFSAVCRLHAGACRMDIMKKIMRVVRFSVKAGVELNHVANFKWQIFERIIALFGWSWWNLWKIRLNE